eukprot:3280758-Pleurochrysis_carterae.AAC.1
MMQAKEAEPVFVSIRRVCIWGCRDKPGVYAVAARSVQAVAWPCSAMCLAAAARVKEMVTK